MNIFKFETIEEALSMNAEFTIVDFGEDEDEYKYISIDVEKYQFCDTEGYDQETEVMSIFRENNYDITIPELMEFLDGNMKDFEVNCLINCINTINDYYYNTNKSEEEIDKYLLSIDPRIVDYLNSTVDIN